MKEDEKDTGFDGKLRNKKEMISYLESEIYKIETKEEDKKNQKPTYSDLDFYSEDDGGIYGKNSKEHKNLAKHFGEDYKNKLVLDEQDDNEDKYNEIDKKGKVLHEHRDEEGADFKIKEHNGKKYVLHNHPHAGKAIGYLK
jgi:hypothetical protein